MHPAPPPKISLTSLMSLFARSPGYARNWAANSFSAISVPESLTMLPLVTTGPREVHAKTAPVGKWTSPLA